MGHLHTCIVISNSAEWLEWRQGGSREFQIRRSGVYSFLTLRIDLETISKWKTHAARWKGQKLTFGLSTDSLDIKGRSGGKKGTLSLCMSNDNHDVFSLSLFGLSPSLLLRHLMRFTCGVNMAKWQLQGDNKSMPASSGTRTNSRFFFRFQVFPLLLDRLVQKVGHGG